MQAFLSGNTCVKTHILAYTVCENALAVAYSIGHASMSNRRFLRAGEFLRRPAVRHTTASTSRGWTPRLPDCVYLGSRRAFLQISHHTSKRPREPTGALRKMQRSKDAPYLARSFLRQMWDSTY